MEKKFIIMNFIHKFFLKKCLKSLLKWIAKKKICIHKIIIITNYCGESFSEKKFFCSVKFLAAINIFSRKKFAWKTFF